jgi:hypothetical protein
MKKKILIGIGIFVLIIVVGFMYLNYRNRSLSPPGEAQYDKNGLKIEVSYSRPSVRDRLIFGPEEDGALQPYGVYWRLGANEATEITFNRDVLFNGQELASGTYWMYAMPGADEFQIILNSETGKWGAFEPDHSLDLLKTMVPAEKGGHVEQFTISIVEEGAGAAVVCAWSDVKVRIPVEAQ